MHPSNSLEVCDYLELICAHFQICYTRKALGCLAISYETNDLELQEICEKIPKPIECLSDRKVIQNRPNFKLTLVIKMIRHYSRKTHKGFIVF